MAFIAALPLKRGTPLVALQHGRTYRPERSCRGSSDTLLRPVSARRHRSRARCVARVVRAFAWPLRIARFQTVPFLDFIARFACGLAEGIPPVLREAIPRLLVDDDASDQ